MYTLNIEIKTDDPKHNFISTGLQTGYEHYSDMVLDILRMLAEVDKDSNEPLLRCEEDSE